MIDRDCRNRMRELDYAASKTIVGNTVYETSISATRYHRFNIIRFPFFGNRR